MVIFIYFSKIDKQAMKAKKDDIGKIFDLRSQKTSIWNFRLIKQQCFFLKEQLLSEKKGILEHSEKFYVTS